MSDPAERRHLSAFERYLSVWVALCIVAGVAVGNSGLAYGLVTAISLFGLTSGATLATVVGVLVEVPVMLSVCVFCNRTRHWFPARVEADVLARVEIARS